MMIWLSLQMSDIDNDFDEWCIGLAQINSHNLNTFKFIILRAQLQDVQSPLAHPWIWIKILPKIKCNIVLAKYEQCSQYDK